MLARLVSSIRKRLEGYSWLSDLPAMLCWAALVGVLGAFATIAFHEGMQLLQQLIIGDSGSIVRVTEGLPWYGRLLFPMAGGVAAGTLLWGAAKIKAGADSDYMEAVAIGDGRRSLRRVALFLESAVREDLISSAARSRSRPQILRRRSRGRPLRRKRCLDVGP